MRWLLVGMLMLVVALAGCANDSDGGSPPTGDGPETTTDGSQPQRDLPGPGEIAIDDSQPPPDDPLGALIEYEQGSIEARAQKVLADAEALGPLLNDFWTRELMEVYNLDFDPPDRYEYYIGDTNPPCGDSAEAAADNAYYCPVEGDEHIAFDLAWLQNYLREAPGGSTTFLILAHEWGHAVQDTWLESGGTDVWDPTYTQELNADCLAGVFLARSIDQGLIIEEAGDSDAIFKTLYAIGSSPWLAPEDHGTSTQRQQAFLDGVQQETDYCRVNY